ncbi:MAG: SCO family protein [Defluviimonas sp.]|uniref:SCO family protein n=1 Tax=Albidovulum sp. TaxID=1872424 RepID=UPI002A30D4BB|nr:SCO family protein [Defluviimonas sp.]
MAVSTRSYAIAAVSVAALALLATYAVTRGGDEGRFANCTGTRVAGGGAIGGPFTLTDENGQRVTDKDVLKDPSFVYFGYTFCPDICPADTARNAEAVDALEEMGYDVTPVFISVDPNRDKPEVLKEWTEYIHPKMIGLTGTPEEIASVAKEYKTYYKVPDDTSDPYYVVDHMTQTYLMLPGYGFVTMFSREDPPEDMAKTTACFLDAAKG